MTTASRPRTVQAMTTPQRCRDYTIRTLRIPAKNEGGCNFCSRPDESFEMLTVLRNTSTDGLVARICDYCIMDLIVTHAVEASA